MKRNNVGRRTPAHLLWIVAAVMGSGAVEDEALAADTVSEVQLTRLKTEYRVNPLGIDVTKPRLSWRLKSEGRDIRQTAYQIRVALSEEGLERASKSLWDSGRIASIESTQRGYSGPPLHSRQRYHWKVRVWNQNGSVSDWSPAAWWEMGMLHPADWSAQWIDPQSTLDQAPMLRRAFVLKGNIRQARAYVTSHGLYQLFLNGERVGDMELTPGFTSYHKRLQYQTYDVTRFLKHGRNAVGALLGEGWYTGLLDWVRKRHEGHRTALLMQLEVTYTDGTTERIVSDEQWRATPGPIVMSGLYAGETYDARREPDGWAASDFNDAQWTPVKEIAAPPPREVLVAQNRPPVRKMEELRVQRILRSPQGKTLLDMGQNMVGWIRLRVKGPAGTTVILRHGEVLDPAGELYTANLRSAKQTVRYVLKGGDTELYEPHFTFQGFRYVEVDGYPGELTADNVTGIVVRSDIALTSEFESSNPLLNQLHSNIVWSQKGNFLEVPMDCPQRDERLGWTADAQLFSRTAAFNADVAGFFTKWLKDLVADQRPSGSVPWEVPSTTIAPYNLAFPSMPRNLVPEAMSKFGKQDPAGAAGWGDAAVIIPWVLYQAYGDRRVLEEQYQSMVAWVEYQRRRAGEDLIWDGDYQWADWSDFGPPGRLFPYGKTDPDLVATAYFAHSTDLLSRIARVLGKGEDADRYTRLFSAVREAFQSRFVSADSTVSNGTQTAYVLALRFDLLGEPQRAAAAQLLVEDVRRQGHLTTGILGTSGLLFALSEQGYLEDAYRLLLREDYPSWLFEVKHGATTIWERWNGIGADGSFENPLVNSLNHYAHGAVGEWMYRVAAGINIDPEAPGYKQILIHPQPGGGLHWVKAMHETPYGKVSSYWRIDENRFFLTAVVPPNTSAIVRLPSTRPSAVREGNSPLAIGRGILDVRQEGADIIVKVGSGRYQFAYPR